MFIKISLRNCTVAIGVQISEMLSLQIKIMHTIVYYEIVYKKNIHVNILRDQMLQQKLGTITLSKPRMKLKVYFMVEPIF